MNDFCCQIALFSVHHQQNLLRIEDLPHLTQKSFEIPHQVCMKFSGLLLALEAQQNYWMDSLSYQSTNSLLLLLEQSQMLAHYPSKLALPFLRKCTLNLSVFLTVSFLIMFLICHSISSIETFPWNPNFGTSQNLHSIGHPF